MKKQLEKQVIQRIMDRAIEHNKTCPLECRDFRIMISPKRENTLILRWTTINIDDMDRPEQCYQYECFNTDGSPQHCSVNYSDQQEANTFFFSLETLYRQDYAYDHIIKDNNPLNA